MCAYFPTYISPNCWQYLGGVRNESQHMKVHVRAWGMTDIKSYSSSLLAGFFNNEIIKFGAMNQEDRVMR